LLVAYGWLEQVTVFIDPFFEVEGSSNGHFIQILWALNYGKRSIGLSVTY
jgi:hypothetical protein